MFDSFLEMIRTMLSFSAIHILLVIITFICGLYSIREYRYTYKRLTGMLYIIAGKSPSFLSLFQDLYLFSCFSSRLYRSFKQFISSCKCTFTSYLSTGYKTFIWNMLCTCLGGIHSITWLIVYLFRL